MKGQERAAGSFLSESSRMQMKMKMEDGVGEWNAVCESQASYLCPQKSSAPHASRHFRPSTYYSPVSAVVEYMAGELEHCSTAAVGQLSLLRKLCARRTSKLMQCRVLFRRNSNSNWEPVRLQHTVNSPCWITATDWLQAPAVSKPNCARGGLIPQKRK